MSRKIDVTDLEGAADAADETAKTSLRTAMGAASEAFVAQSITTATEGLVPNSTFDAAVANLSSEISQKMTTGADVAWDQLTDIPEDLVPPEWTEAAVVDGDPDTVTVDLVENARPFIEADGAFTLRFSALTPGMSLRGVVDVLNTSESDITVSVTSGNNVTFAPTVWEADVGPAVGIGGEGRVLLKADVLRDGTVLITPTGAIVSAEEAPANLEAPFIFVASGTLGKIGTEHSRNIGGWSPEPESYTQQWKLNGGDISGATAAAYTPVAADDGGTLTVQQTATIDALSGTATSAGVPITYYAPVSAGTPAPWSVAEDTGTQFYDISNLVAVQGDAGLDSLTVTMVDEGGQVFASGVYEDGVFVGSEGSEGYLDLNWAEQRLELDTTTSGLITGATIALVFENSGGEEALGIALTVSAATVAPTFDLHISDSSSGTVITEHPVDGGLLYAVATNITGTPTPEILSIQWLVNGVAAGGDDDGVSFSISELDVDDEVTVNVVYTNGTSPDADEDSAAVTMTASTAVTPFTFLAAGGHERYWSLLPAAYADLYQQNSGSPPATPAVHGDPVGSVFDKVMSEYHRNNSSVGGRGTLNVSGDIKWVVNSNASNYYASPSAITLQPGWHIFCACRPSDDTTDLWRPVVGIYGASTTNYFRIEHNCNTGGLRVNIRGANATPSAVIARVHEVTTDDLFTPGVDDIVLSAFLGNATATLRLNNTPLTLGNAPFNWTSGQQVADAMLRGHNLGGAELAPNNRTYGWAAFRKADGSEFTTQEYTDIYNIMLETMS